MTNRKLVLYISMSLDGYLATKDDDLSWLNSVQVEGEDYGYGAFTENVDTYIVGRKTYDVVRELTGGDFPQAQQYNCYIITREERPNVEGMTFYNGDLEKLISQLKEEEEGGNIYCDGGGEVVRLLMDKNLIDEFIISVIPILLGDGKRLFNGGISPIDIRLISSKAYDSGLVQLHYSRR